MLQLGSPLFWLIMGLSLVGSFVAASAGFGFGIILVGALQFFMQPVELVSLIMILICVSSTLRVIETRKIAHRGRAVRFIIFALLGVPLGVALLKYLNPVLMKRYMNLALLAGIFMLAYSMKGPRPLRIENRQMVKILEAFVGFVSGFLSGSCSLPGPPIVMWGVLNGWGKIEMHAALARFFFAIVVFSLINLSINGVYSRSTISVSLALIPAVFAGFKMGTWVRDRITEMKFRLYVLAFLSLSGLTGFFMSFV